MTFNQVCYYIQRYSNFAFLGEKITSGVFFCLRQSRRNGFQSGGAMEDLIVLSSTIGWPIRKLANSRRSRMAKTITFWPCWSLLIVSAFKPFLYFICFPFFFFLLLSPPGPARCRRPCTIDRKLVSLFFPTLHFYKPWKHHETVRYRKAILGKNELTNKKERSLLF